MRQHRTAEEIGNPHAVIGGTSNARVMGETLHTFDGLGAITRPPVQGPQHLITEHQEVAGCTREAITQVFGRQVEYEETYATSGSRLIKDVRYKDTIMAMSYRFPGLATRDGKRCPTLAGLSSTGQEISLQYAGGAHTFVCCNLLVSGEWDLGNRKHTTGLRLQAHVMQIVAEFSERIGETEKVIQRLEEREVTRTQSAAVTLGLFRSGTLPVRMLKPVCEALFDARAEDVPEVAETRGSLMAIGHAVTRVLRDEPQRRQAEMSGLVTGRLLAAA